MARFSDRSIGEKLRAIVLAGIAVALLISFMTVVGSEFRQELGQIRAQANIYADLVIENGSAPMRFEDVASAERLLGSLRHVGAIRAAVLLRNDGQVFATYPSDLVATHERFGDLIKAQGEGEGRWQFPRYIKSWPVLHDGEKLGDLVLDVSLAENLSDLAEWTLFACVGLLVGGLAATMLVRRAEQSIVRPIIRLAAMVRDVRNHARFDLRAPAGPRDEVGDLIDGVNSMLSEIEERDSALAAHRDRLEIEVAHRTEELSAAKEEADRARDEAQDANRAKSLFLANMSHEIRTPMNGVLGMVELLRGTPMNERQSRMIDTLHGSAESLLYLINDVLDVSKIEAGKLELDSVDFSPRKAVEDVALLFAERAQQKGVELILDIAPDLPETVCADGHRFRQVLNNLVSNAVKFTASGFIRIAVRSAVRDHEVRLQVQVEDSGIGIPDDMRPRLFQAFSQADSSMARRYGGTGLGLAISRQLAQLMGGSLTEDSEPGCGARFNFDIEAALVTAATPVAIGPLRVAVVGGVARQREVLARHIQAYGADVSTFEDDGALTTAVASDGRFDVLLVDGQVSGERGRDRFETIKAAADRMVALVRLRSASDEEDARQSGAGGSLSKPVLDGQLIRVLEGKSVSASARRPERTVGLRTNARVLVAEDHPVNAEIVCALLGECGCRVTVAANGREAVAAYQAGAFDLVLMDIQMPEMDGVEATQRIREIERESGHDRVPIVALTANALHDDRSAALSAGMDDYLTKPLTGERLRAALARWLTGVAAVELTAPKAEESAAEETSASAPARAEAELPLFELKTLLGVPGVKGNREAPLLKRLLTLFVRETSIQLDQLEQVLAVGDAEEGQRIVHKMKSAAASVGASRLAAQARELDARLKVGGIDGAAERAAMMRLSFTGYMDALESHGISAETPPSTVEGNDG
ncbi:hybrid sensor histidine kinase/response regulator [Nitrogeniibacter aestuarii]|uniref:hybrid sensor histidine kinase/response regulator n=1 Tax=Nitrogeniibacter aestuarii TaxID=2815343 RepID=UPI001E37A8B3|nr:response regulator [Nitrogeniibacter aestuarii]